MSVWQGGTCHKVIFDVGLKGPQRQFWQIMLAGWHLSAVGGCSVQIEKVYCNLSRRGKADVVRLIALDIIEQTFSKEENFPYPIYSIMRDYIYDGLGDWVEDVANGISKCEL